MSELPDKMTLIFWPYLRLIVVFLAVYGLLDGTLLMWAPAFEPPEELRKLLVPLLLAVLLVLVVLWPRLRLLRAGGGRNDPRVFLAILAMAVMGFGTNCLHNYLVSSIGRLEALDSPAAVFPDRPQALYYSFRHLYQTPRYVGVQSEISTSNKGRKLNFYLYVVTPMLASPTDTKRPATVWRALRYTEQISTNASDAEKESAYQIFARRSQTQFEEVDGAQTDFNYFQRLPNTRERDAYLRAARRTRLCPADTTQPLLILEPGEEIFARRGQKWAGWLLGWVAGGSLLFFIILLFSSLEIMEVNDFRAGNYARLSAVPSWLLPAPGYVLTPALLLANGGIYLCMALSTRSGIESFAPPDLLAWGANFGPAVAAGQWWRLLSSAFLHGSILHIINNMVLLGLLGGLLEKPMGTARLAVLYLLAGVGGSVASLLWHPATVSIGASGAIFGLMGATLTLVLGRALPRDLRGTLLGVVLLAGSVSLLLGWLMPGTDNAAHLGGLLTGALVGVVFIPGLRRQLPYNEAMHNG